MEMALLLKTTLVATMLLHCGLARKHLHVNYQWKTPDYAFPSEAVRQTMISNGSYIPGNPFMLDVDVWHIGSRQEVFVTTPRFEPGTPATLSVLCHKHSRHGDPASPLLEPYPSWAWNRQGDCDAMTSVLRVQFSVPQSSRESSQIPQVSSYGLPLDYCVFCGLLALSHFIYLDIAVLIIVCADLQVDACGRLWTIDSGVVDLMTGAKFICPPQVLVFDLRTSRLLRRYRIPKKDLGGHSLLINIAVDIRPRGNSCKDTFAYIADVTDHGLVVYDASRNMSWRVTSEVFDPSPSATHFTIAGESFDLTDGLFGLALSPIKAGDRTLYLHSLARFRESWVSTSIVRKESLFVDNTSAAAAEIHESSGTRPSQTAATAMNKNAVLFFSLLSNMTLNCWNSHLPYSRDNLVELARDENTLQFVSGMKVVRDRAGKETLWALSCRFQKLMTGSFNTREVNFRIMTAPVADLMRGTSCDVLRS
ncbi:hypothetical protein PR048_009034 [Dryococelus australis]|uniref:Uncharacterized protein n=1 Tax=Dryococelus australis TaxID=614101 RepID=A0ABQ9HYR7_9NEOP|nr:hypothetical protein PR048_009034 [Dryococelus australis]